MMEMTEALDDNHNSLHKDDDVELQKQQDSRMTPLELEDIHADDDEDDEEEEGRSLLVRNGASRSDGDRLRNGHRNKQKRKRKVNDSSSNRIWQKHWLGNDDDSDTPWRWHREGNDDNDDEGTVLLDATTLKFFKFMIITTGCMLFVHAYVWIVGDKRDVTYGIREMILYDSNLIVLDLTVLFVVGRMYQHPAVDTLECVVPVLFVAMFQSAVATHVSSLQHSVTAAEMACEWTWQMWALVMLGTVPIILLIGGSHLWAAYQRGAIVQKGIEITASVLVFLAPYMGSTFFHLHHWYYGWLIAMHCNVNTWWSRLCRNVLLGIYINGVAIFGRDPILTCAFSLYQSQNQKCVYIGDDKNYINYTLPQLAHDSGMDALLSGVGGCHADNATIGS